MAPVFQAVYGFAVLVVVLWYTSMVWKVTDDYFRDEYKKHLKTSASEYAAKKKSQEIVIPKEFKEDPPWMLLRKSSSGAPKDDGGLEQGQESNGAVNSKNRREELPQSSKSEPELSDGACYKNGFAEHTGTGDELVACP